MKQFRGLVSKAHRLLYHSTLDSRVIKKKKKGDLVEEFVDDVRPRLAQVLEVDQNLRQVLGVGVWGVGCGI